MTILFFSRLFYPHIGGVEKHVLEISKILIKKGYKVIVVTEELFGAGKEILNQVQNDKDDSGQRKMTGDIEIYRIPVGKEDWFKKFRIWAWLWKHRKIIESADIVHCHDVFFWYLPFRFLYPKKPIFITFHGYETKFPPSKRAIFVRKVSEKLSWGNICVGDYIRKWYRTRPNYVTYGGINVMKSQNSNLKTQIHNSKLIVLLIGRLEKDTGVLTYLRALELMVTKNINFELGVCGDGSLRKKVEQYGHVYGFVEGLDSYINKADIVFASSYLSILQAMANKRLVFAVFDNPLKEDYLKMSPFTKWIVIENSSDKLVSKIEYFMSHYEEKEKIINSGYQWASNQTWQKVVDIYIKLWHSNDTYH